MNCYRMVMAYVIHRDAPGGPAAYIGALAPWDHVFKDTLYATQEMLGDAVAVCFSPCLGLFPTEQGTVRSTGHTWSGAVTGDPYLSLHFSSLSAWVRPLPRSDPYHV